MTYPKQLGACVDKLYTMMTARRKAQQAVDRLKEEETKLEEHILNSFSKSDLEGARGKLAVCGISRSDQPQVEDWDKLYAFIKKTDAWDLLQRRVNSMAYRERLQAEVIVPGVTTFTRVSLSIHTAAKR
jgi:hypothetical protein